MMSLSYIPDGTTIDENIALFRGETSSEGDIGRDGLTELIITATPHPSSLPCVAVVRAGVLTVCQGQLGPSADNVVHDEVVAGAGEIGPLDWLAS